MIRTRHKLITGRLFHSSISVVSKNKETDSPVPPKNETVTKESLQWRTPMDERQGAWYSKFKAFASDHNNTDIIKFLQSPIDLSPSAIKKWYKRRQEETEIALQQYLPERNQMLGDDLAAAHFIVHRGGAVKFVGDNDWTKQDENAEYKLPRTYQRDRIIQAIDCSNMNLYFEGLDNLRGLRKLEWLSLNNCKHMDDWCMDRITGIFQDGLIYLDIRNCPKITDRGLGALYRNKNLRTLYVDDIKLSNSFELTCLMLQELMPQLEIKM